MKFSIHSTEFKNALELGSKAITSNPVLPIIENFYFECADGNGCIKSTDLNISMIVEFGCHSDEDIKTMLPSTPLINLLKNLDPQPITIEVEEASVKVLTQKGSYTFAVEPFEDFPIVEVAQGTPHDVDVEKLTNAIFAASKDELRVALNGIHVNPESGEICVTDTFRLFIDKVGTFDSPSFIIPKAPINALKGLKGEVEMLVDDKRVSFVHSNVTVSGLLIAANFPNYRAVVPTEAETQVTVNRKELIKTIKRVSALRDKNTNQLTLAFSGEGLSVSVVNSEKSSKGNETMECQIQGNNLTIGVNSVYTLECLNALTGEKVLLQMTDSNRPVLIEEDDKELLVMPIMLN